jgi:hypothetical protein
MREFSVVSALLQFRLATGRGSSSKLGGWSTGNNGKTTTMLARAIIVIIV